MSASPEAHRGGDGKRILVVTPYPPRRDGIGAYALQQVRALRRAGNHVEVCSPRPSAAHHHLDLVGLRGARALARLMADFDRVVVHFHPDVFYVSPSTPTSRISTGLALAAAFRLGPPVEIRLHEVDRRWASATDQVEASSHSGPAAKVVFEAAGRATRAVFQAASEVTVHDDALRNLMVDRFGVARDHVRVVAHGADFAGQTALDQVDARAALGLPADDHVFVCIGFVQPHKGFDRAAAAFRGLGGHGASLHIVGSVRVEDPSAAEHQLELEALEAQISGVHLHLGYVSDEAFDRWIVAADTVVLPYRHIWSSSVAERARLHDRPVIATRVGGLAEQLSALPGSVVVDDNAGLAAAMAAAVAGAGAGAGSRGPDAAGGSSDGSDPAPGRSAGPAGRAGGWAFGDGVDRDTVMAEIHRRSAAARGMKVSATTVVGSRAHLAEANVAVPLRRLRHVAVPTATSARPGVSTIKRLIRRVVAWEVDPLREQIASLQEAAIRSAEITDARLDQAADDRPHEPSDSTT
ncbi:MAG: glycosyltransferase family 4 protein [Acidimicrobiales bacterium]